MRENMRYIDVTKLITLVESLKKNTAGPTNGSQLEKSLGLSSNSIPNAKRRGTMNTDDVKKLEDYFNVEIVTARPVENKPADQRPADSEGMRLLRENNIMLKQLTELWLSGKEA